MGTFKRIRIAAPLFAVAFAAIASAPKPVRAEGDEVEKRERCATRVAIALHGAAPTTALLTNPSPQDQVDAMLGDPVFAERFARFTNSEFNPQPGVNAAEDASYTLAKYVLTNKKPWSELFVGGYDVTNTVAVDAAGLGYFRSDAWLRRYAGNEPAGYRLSGAYRILQNTTGLQLTAVTNVAGVDLSATGRQAAACAGCHYQNWYALDKVAKILSRRKGMGANMTFLDPSEGPQQILGGKTIANDKELVTSLVDSTNFKVNACRLAFKYLYGRIENTCEAQVFERCVDAFTKEQTMQSAVAAVAKDPTFCQ